MPARGKPAVIVLAMIGLTIAFFLWLPTPAETTEGADTLPGGHFAITGVRVFDGSEVIESATVVVRDGRVESVTHGSHAERAIPSIDGAGRTLLPGLIDSHTHSWGNALEDAARFGVTTSLDMFTERSFADSKRKGRESFDPKSEADLYSAVTLVTAPGGHGTEYGIAIPTIDRPDDADEFVGQRIEEGSDFIKIVVEGGEAWGMRTPTLDPVTIAAVVKAAHDQGRLAVAHVSTFAAARTAVEAGVDGLVHTFGDEVIDDSLLARAKSRDVFVVSTVSILDNLDRPADVPHPLLTDDTVTPFLTVEQKGTLGGRFPFSGRSVTHAATAIENIRRIHEAGIDVLGGTDAPNPGTAHGVSMHEELARLVDAGFTPREALRAATSLPAERFRLEGRGCIAAGCRADLLLVEGNPTESITATRRIVAVWKNGHPIARSPAARTQRARLDGGELVSDFESGLDAAFGAGWMETTDKIMGGTSTAELSHTRPGAAGSAGAMRVEGEIGKGFPFSWAGAMFFPATEPMQPVDASGRTELVFRVRSDRKELRVMAFAESLASRPAERRIPVTTDWTEVRVPLSQFAGLELDGLRAFAICAGPQPGPFHFEVDDVRLK